MEAVTAVKVRMYRHGFGDCFLLRFYAGRVRTFAMLIDCGLKLNDKVPGVSLADVVKDIKALLNEGKPAQGKPYLDVLVVTHEHWDHVSGFYPKEKLFDKFSIGKIWMAWTENPADREGAMIRRHIRKTTKALKLANEHLADSPSAAPGFFCKRCQGRKSRTGCASFPGDSPGSN